MRKDSLDLVKTTHANPRSDSHVNPPPKRGVNDPGGSNQSPPNSKESSYYVQHHNTSQQSLPSFPQIFIDRWVNEYHLEEQELLTEMDLPKREFFKLAKLFRDVLGSKCVTTGYKAVCPQCGEVNFRPKYCNDRYRCPVCNRVYAVQAGTRILAKLKELKPLAIGFFEPTYPFGWFDWVKLSKKEIEEQIFKDVKAFMKKIGVEGYFVRVHSWSSKLPLTEPHFHPHIIFPLWEENPYWDVKWLREEWRKHIGYSEEVNVHYHYTRIRFDGWGYVEHYCNYMCRGAVVDINKFLLKFGDPGELDSYDRGWFDYHTSEEKKHTKIRAFGSLSNAKITKTLEREGGSLAHISQVIKERRSELLVLYCWNCDYEFDSLTEWEFTPVIDPEKLANRKNDRWRMFLEVKT